MGQPPCLSARSCRIKDSISSSRCSTRGGGTKVKVTQHQRQHQQLQMQHERLKHRNIWINLKEKWTWSSRMIFLINLIAQRIKALPNLEKSSHNPKNIRQVFRTNCNRKTETLRKWTIETNEQLQKTIEQVAQRNIGAGPEELHDLLDLSDQLDRAEDKSAAQFGEKFSQSQEHQASLQNELQQKIDSINRFHHQLNAVRKEMNDNWTMDEANMFEKINTLFNHFKELRNSLNTKTETLRKWTIETNEQLQKTIEQVAQRNIGAGPEELHDLLDLSDQLDRAEDKSAAQF